jgi:V/A-type H+-transporting ATPase subunit D
MSKLINPTRMELTRTKRRLITALRGHKLLKDKQDEMARQFMNYIKQNMELRKKVEQKLSESMNEIALASAKMGDKNVEEALMMPVRYVDINPLIKNIMSVNVPVLDFDKPDKNLNLPYSFI